MQHRIDPGLSDSQGLGRQGTEPIIMAGANGHGANAIKQVGPSCCQDGSLFLRCRGATPCGSMPERLQRLKLFGDGAVGPQSAIVHVTTQIPGVQLAVVGISSNDLAAGCRGRPAVALAGINFKVQKLAKFGQYPL